MIHQLAEASRKSSMSERVGTVHEVWRKDGIQKIRVQIGLTPDGEPWLTPWMHTEDHRGPHREQEKYHKGQTVKVNAINGDFRQATAGPYHENDKHKEPAHANDDDHTYQYGASRGTQGKDWSEQWLAKANDDKDSDKALVRVRMGKKPEQKQSQNDGRGEGPKDDEPKPEGIYSVDSDKEINLTTKVFNLKAGTTAVIKVGNAVLTMTGTKINMKVDTDEIEVDNKGVWLNNPNKIPIKVMTESGPAKKVFAVPE